MAINFPDSPSLNEIFADATTGFTYQWNGTVWVNYNVSTPAKIQELDDISGSFNGSTQTFSLTVSSGAVTPVKPDQLIINIGGVAQNPGVDYTLSGSNITFTTAPTAGLSFYGVLLGGSTSITSVESGTVRPDSFTTGGPTWNTGGDLKVTGVTTIANTGSASTALYVSGNARITGIVTVGSSSITIDGSNNSIKVGTGATLNASGITVGIITGKFYGNGSGLSNVGVGTTGSINTSGIVTASSFYGDGSGLTNLGGPLSVLTYQPSIGATNIDLNPTIVLTFNKPIKANTGTITLRTGSASGAIIESYSVGTGSSVTISGGVLTITPTVTLGVGVTHYLVIPSGAYKDDFESSSNSLIDNYYFKTVDSVYQLFAWGTDGQGQLGQNNAGNRSSPIQIPGTQWSKVTAYYHVTATKTDGTLWTWAQNSNGQLGQNDVQRRSSPTQVPGTQWNAISAGYTHTFATKTDGTLWVWGRNNVGELGKNNKTYYSSPVQIPGTQWNNISASIFYSLATKTDGTLWAWGSSGSGQLAQNNVTYYSSPVQIPGTQWNKPFTGYVWSGATKTDGTLWAWGYNPTGVAGQNDRIDYSSPRQVPGTQWNNVSAGYYHVLATKTDGTLWAWGSEGDGSVGQNNNVRYSSPVQIPGTSWVLTDDSGSGYTSLARKTDGTLWAWGKNGSGQLSTNDGVARSSPTQIPGTQWNATSQGYASCFVIKSPI
jgi:alpha-tubulin suppressor-like RCC1 family protein